MTRIAKNKILVKQAFILIKTAVLLFRSGKKQSEKESKKKCYHVAVSIKRKNNK